MDEDRFLWLRPGLWRITKDLGLVAFGVLIDAAALAQQGGQWPAIMVDGRPATVEDLPRGAVEKRAVQKALRRLMKAGYIQKGSDGVYRLTDEATLWVRPGDAAPGDN